MTAANLEKRLRFAFDCSTVVWKKSSGWVLAKADVDKGRTIVTLPAGYDDDFTLRTLLHELCHVAIHGELASFGIFEEEILVRVIEPVLMEYVTGNTRKHEWWLKKLKEVGWSKRLRELREAK